MDGWNLRLNPAWSGAYFQQRSMLICKYHGFCMTVLYLEAPVAIALSPPDRRRRIVQQRTDTAL
jgi:hypothetical protein